LRRIGEDPARYPGVMWRERGLDRFGLGKIREPLVDVVEDLRFAAGEHCRRLVHVLGGSVGALLAERRSVAVHAIESEADKRDLRLGTPRSRLLRFGWRSQIRPVPAVP